MKHYLVGGAVRDALLGLPVKERDWVVTGATPEDMAAQGYKAVGKDFPVFLHPETKEEHALARTERKTARGYHGFSFYTGPEVTLEEDLIRRDLTVNAIAQAEDGQLVDPYGGRKDIEAKILRHVSEAFAEDPVRILRIARFHARFAPLAFSIAPETMELMRSMVAAGEVDALVAERVWKEAERALMGEKPSVFFQTLRDCGALARIMPEVDALFGVPQRPEYHPEIDSGIHTLMCIDQAAKMNAPLPVRATALLHDLGKAITPKDVLPRHLMHEVRGVPLVEKFCERLRLPAAIRDLAVIVTRDHLNVHRAQEMGPPKLLELLERLQALRKPDVFRQALDACLCDKRGRLGLEDQPYPSYDYLLAAAKAANAIQAKDVMQEGLTGPAIGEALKQRRVAALKSWKAGYAADADQH